MKNTEKDSRTSGRRTAAGGRPGSGAAAGRRSGSGTAAGRKTGRRAAAGRAGTKKSGRKASSGKKGRPLTRKENRRIRKRTRIFTLIVLAGAAMAYLVCAGQYKTKFIPGTVINGEAFGDRSEDEVEKTLAGNADAYSLTLNFRGGGHETLGASEIGYRYVNDGTVARLLSIQPRYTWIAGIFGSTNHVTARFSHEYDGDKLTAALEALPELQTENEKAPVDAYMRITNAGNVEIVPEDNGNLIDEAALQNAVETALAYGETELDLDESGVYVKPQYTSESQELVDQTALMNRYMSMVVTYHMTDGTDTVLDSSEISNWLRDDPDHPGWYTVTETSLHADVSSFIASLAEKDDVTRTATVFHSTNYGEVSVPISGTYGHTLDQDSMVLELEADFRDFTSAAHDMTYSWNESDPTDIGDTYIEVDIAAQHVYCYQDGSLVKDFSCVTGLESDETRRTPSGVYRVLQVLKDHTMTGSYGTAYGNYVIAFSRLGLCLHDASWRGSFGGSIYKTDGSHGCVNLSYDSAKWLYENVREGEPVIVFRPD